MKALESKKGVLGVGKEIKVPYVWKPCINMGFQLVLLLFIKIIMIIMIQR